MTDLTPVVAARLGGADLNPTQAAANNDTIPAGPKTWLLVKNGSGSPVTLTWKAPTGTGPGGTSYADLALTPAVPATTGLVMFGPFPATPWADPATNLVKFTYSATASVTVKAVQTTD
jgi:hypothetical protein